MASTTGDLDRLSGVVLPLILQRKLKSQQEAERKAETNNKKSKSGNDTSAVLQDDDGRANSIFTAQELGELTWKTRSAMADIQRQLLRGEESYHEETNAHGSLFRGWDLFIDAKDPGAPAVSTASNRRMPADNRWFSSSCTSAGRTPRPMPALNKNLLLKKAPVARSASSTLPKAAVANAASGRGTAKPVGDVKAGVLPQDGGVAARVAGIPSGGALTRPTLPIGGAQAAARGQTAGSSVQGQVNASASDVAASSIQQGEAGSGRRTRKRKASDA